MPPSNINECPWMNDAAGEASQAMVFPYSYTVPMRFKAIVSVIFLASTSTDVEFA
jgi:hypothetical protein